MNDWFSMQHAGNRAFASIHGEIGVFGQTSSDFIAALGDSESVELMIDSSGGNSITGLNLYAGLRDRAVEVVILGRCASSALIAACAGTKISAMPAARLLVHAPSNALLGTAKELRAAAEELDRLTDQFEHIIAERCEQPLATVRDWLSHDTYFSATKALRVGLIDEILPAPTPRITSASKPSAADSIMIPETEQMFLAWLTAFGQVEVRDVEKFRRELLSWSASNVRQTTPQPI